MIRISSFEFTRRQAEVLFLGEEVLSQVRRRLEEEDEDFVLYVFENATEVDQSDLGQPERQRVKGLFVKTSGHKAALLISPPSDVLVHQYDRRLVVLTPA